jgi:hypothetical protein
MALTRPGGYIRTVAPTVTFLNGKGSWTQNQITQYQTQRRWPQEFSTVLHIAQGSSSPTLLFAWTGSALAYSTYTPPATAAFRGSTWDRAGRVLFFATSGNIIGYEFTKAGGIVSTYATPTITYPPGTSTLQASPVTDRLWWWSSDIQGRLCSISYDPVTKTFGTFSQAVYLNNYPSSGDKRPSISPDGNFYGNGNSSSSVVLLYRINSDGTSSGAVSTPASVSSTGANTYNVAWSPSGAAIGIGLSAGTPRFRLFRWSADTYYGSEYSYANYTGTALGAVWKVFWNNAGNVIFFLVGNAPFLTAYQWDDTNGIGSRFADPSGFTWSVATTANVMLSPDDKLLVFNSAGTSGSDVALAWDNTTGFGAVTTMPVGLANANSVAFGTVTN